MLIEAWHTSKPEVKKWIDGTDTTVVVLLFFLLL